jgi:hypothetical protein
VDWTVTFGVAVAETNAMQHVSRYVPKYPSTQVLIARDGLVIHQSCDCKTALPTTYTHLYLSAPPCPSPAQLRPLFTALFRGASKLHSNHAVLRDPRVMSLLSTRRTNSLRNNSLPLAAWRMHRSCSGRRRRLVVSSPIVRTGRRCKACCSTRRRPTPQPV